MSGAGLAPTAAHTFGQLAPALAANGYRPLPLRPRQKNPIPSGWPTYDFANGDETKWSEAGTGLLTGEVVAIDIDVFDKELADQISDVVVQHLGEAPVRFGQSPKRLLIYRTDAPFLKKATYPYRLPSDAPDAKAHRVEVLAEGQQFVAFGIHPDTGRPYEWIGDDPLTVPFDDLNTISEVQVDALLAEIDQFLAAHGAPVGSLKDEGGHGEHIPNAQLRGDPDAVRDAIKHIPNNNEPYEQWIRIGMAAKGALGDEGYDAWEEWSARSTKNNIKQDTRRTWEALNPNRIGAGTIFDLAWKHGWQGSTVTVIPSDIEIPPRLRTPEAMAHAAMVNAAYGIPAANYTQTNAEAGAVRAEEQ